MLCSKTLIFFQLKNSTKNSGHDSKPYGPRKIKFHHKLSKLCIHGNYVFMILQFSPQSPNYHETYFRSQLCVIESNALLKAWLRTRKITLFYGKLTFARNYTRHNHNFSQTHDFIRLFHPGSLIIHEFLYRESKQQFPLSEICAKLSFHNLCCMLTAPDTFSLKCSTRDYFKSFGKVS